MAEIVNLNRYRKARQKAEEEQASLENRAKFGRTKVERTRESSEADRIRRMIEDARLNNDGNEPA